MELRLCSLVIARWYQTILFGASIAGVQPPRDLPPILKQRVASDLAAAKDSAELHERLMDRLLWPRPLLSVDHMQVPRITLLGCEMTAPGRNATK